jgi:hypothetical protein
MANELTTRNNNAVANAGAASGNPFLSAASSLGGGNDGLTFAGFSGKTGDYTYGAEKDELDDGWEGAVNMNSAKQGHICWKDSEVVGEDMTRILDGNPTPKGQLEDHGPYDDDDDGWQQQISFEVAVLEGGGDAEGEKLLLKNSSKSGIRAFGNLLAAYGKAIQKGQNIENGEELLPIVKFEATEFTPKGAKKKEKAYAPKFTIVGWISETELEEKYGGENDASNYDEDEGDSSEADEEVVKEEKVVEKKAEEAAATGGRRRRF